MLNFMYVAQALLVLVLVWAVYAFNRCIRNRNLVREAWSGVDVQLKRRHDLVPQLVECVKGYRDHEAALLENVALARSRARAVYDIGEVRTAENALTQELRSLIAVVEAYPDLKAGANFRQLMTSLVEIEDQLQYARRYYNGTVRDFNIVVESFPGILLAKLAGFHAAAFFEIESSVERQVPEVKL